MIVKSARWDWISDYITTLGEPVSMTDSDFVDDYVSHTGASHVVRLWGAHKCALLAKDLSDMNRNRILKRHVVGIQGMGGMGFPTWCYAYSIRYPMQKV